MNTDSLYVAFGCAFLGVFILAGLAMYFYDRFVLTLQTLHPDVWGEVGRPPVLSKFRATLDRKSHVPVICIFVLHRKLAKMPPLPSTLKALLVSTEIATIVLFVLIGTVFILACRLPM